MRRPSRLRARAAAFAVVAALPVGVWAVLPTAPSAAPDAGALQGQIDSARSRDHALSADAAGFVALAEQVRRRAAAADAAQAARISAKQAAFAAKRAAAARARAARLEPLRAARRNCAYLEHVVADVHAQQERSKNYFRGGSSNGPWAFP